MGSICSSMRLAWMVRSRQETHDLAGTDVDPVDGVGHVVGGFAQWGGQSRGPMLREGERVDRDFSIRSGPGVHWWPGGISP